MTRSLPFKQAVRCCLVVASVVAALCAMSARSVADDAPAASVEKIYPTADRLPANLLKFYLYFSAPMRETAAVFDHLHLIDACGNEVPDPWRRLPLWSDDSKRLTLLVHPGRIKRGVNLREELGPVLRPGEKYTLVIDAEVLDRKGRPLGKRYQKRFTALAEDGECPSLDRWELAVPRQASTDVLEVSFDEPLEHALSRRLLQVRDAEGNVVAGSVELARHETQWLFRPEQPWRGERYTLVADALLEDLAGNTPLRPFDADLDQPDTAPKVTTRAFQPRPSTRLEK